MCSFLSILGGFPISIEKGRDWVDILTEVFCLVIYGDDIRSQLVEIL